MDDPTLFPDPAAADADGGVLTGGRLSHLLLAPGARSKPVRFRCGPRMLVPAGHRTAADGSLVLVLVEARPDQQVKEYRETMPADSVRDKKTAGRKGGSRHV